MKSQSKDSLIEEPKLKSLLFWLKNSLLFNIKTFLNVFDDFFSIKIHYFIQMFQMNYS